MELTREVLKKLAEPFGMDKIKFKIQTKPSEKGNALVVAYIDARDVMDRLDEVVAGDWSDEYRPATIGGVQCNLTVMGVTRCDVGTSGDNEPEKAAYSDAFKRAAVKFGIGRFLYTLPKMWARVVPAGKSHRLADGEEENLRRKVASFLAYGKSVDDGAVETAKNLGGVDMTAKVNALDGTTVKTVVAKKIFENEKAAAQVLAKFKPQKAPLGSFVDKARLYRAWKDAGFKTEEAVDRAN